VTFIIRSIAQSARFLALALLAMVSCAFLDRIPDPPGTFESVPSIHATVGLAEPYESKSLLPGSQARTPRLDETAFVFHRALAFDNLSRWRVAGDSSPPVVC